MILYILLSIWMILLLIIGLKYEPVSIDDTEKNKIIAEKNLKVHRFLFVITMLLLWGLTAFRSINIGNDTKTYIEYFKIFSQEGITRNRTFELGYQMLNVAISLFTNNPHIFLIIISSIMYIGTGVYIYKYSQNLLVSTVLFFCFCFSIYMNIFRQGIAIVLALFAYNELKINNKKKFVFLIIIACLFHTSAIVMFLLLIKDKIFVKTENVLFLTLLIVLLAITGITNGVFLIVLPRYAHYFSSRYASSGWLAVSYEMIRNLFIYFVVDMCSKQDSKLSVVRMNYVWLLFVSALGYSVNLFTRASEYFLIISIVEIVNLVLYKTKPVNRKSLISIICISMLIMFNIILVFRPNWNHLYPYEFWK